MARQRIAALADLTILLATSCNRPQARLSDERAEQLRTQLPGMTEACLEKVKSGGLDAFPAETDACFEMTPSRRWQGLWRDDFEGSRFCPAPATTCLGDDPGESIWLSFREEAARPKPDHSSVYAIDFVGRRTLHKGHHGHLGVSDHEIIVDRLVTLRRVDRP